MFGTGKWKQGDRPMNVLYVYIFEGLAMAIVIICKFKFKCM